jgi:Putative prokaryotic signal transducing protein
MKDWFLLYTTTLYTQASIVQGMLEENQVPVRVINRQDSMYHFIGEIEIYVPFYLKDIAAGLLTRALCN